MAMIQSPVQLMHVGFDKPFRQWGTPSFHCLIEIVVHQLEYQCQATGFGIKQYLFQRYNVWMRQQSPQGLDLPQIVHLANACEGALHDLHCIVPVIGSVLCLDNFRKGSFSLLGNESVVAHRAAMIVIVHGEDGVCLCSSPTGGLMESAVKSSNLGPRVNLIFLIHSWYFFGSARHSYCSKVN